MFEAQAAILPKLFERRHLELIEAVRYERRVIAAKKAADGTLRTGGFIVEVSNAYVAKFEQFAQALTSETLDLFGRSGTPIDVAAAQWIREKVGHHLDVGARNVQGEAEGGKILAQELKDHAARAVDQSLGRMRRDLDIELDLALVAKAPPIASAVENIREFLDALVDLEDRRGTERDFVTMAADRAEPLCVVLFDIDKFKDVNDKHGGHDVGDEALKAVAQVAAHCLRGKGRAYRHGGDEFVLLLPNHTIEEGLAVAERFRREVSKSPRTSAKLTLTVSVGVACWPEHGETLEDVRKAADTAMYDAKKRGRDLVRHFGEPEPTPKLPSREPSRKQVESTSELTAEQQRKVREDYFRTGLAKCPKDQAVLSVQDTTTFGRSTKTIWVNCPLCGLSEELV